MTDLEFIKLITPDTISFIDNCVFKILGKPDEDIRQTALLKAWTARAKFDGKYFRAWIYRITYNAAIDEIRKKGSTRAENIDDHSYLLDNAQDLLNDIEIKDLISVARKCVSRENFKIIELSAQGYTMKEIAKIMKITKSRAENKKYWSRKQMQELKNKK